MEFKQATIQVIDDESDAARPYREWAFGLIVANAESRYIRRVPFSATPKS
jgi:hypothetical protein